MKSWVLGRGGGGGDSRCDDDDNDDGDGHRALKKDAPIAASGQLRVRGLKTNMLEFETS